MRSFWLSSRNWLQLVRSCDLYKNWLNAAKIKIDWIQQKSDFTISKTKSINLMNSVHNEMMHELSDVFLHLISADSFFGEEKKSTIWRRTGFRVITKPNAKIILNAVWIGGNANTHYAMWLAWHYVCFVYVWALHR